MLVLHRLHAYCAVSQKAVAAIRKAASHTTAHIARIHFLKLHLVFLAQLSRMQASLSSRLRWNAITLQVLWILQTRFSVRLAQESEESAVVAALKDSHMERDCSHDLSAQVLICTMLMSVINTYNSLVDLVPMLPFKGRPENLSGEHQ